MKTVALKTVASGYCLVSRVYKNLGKKTKIFSRIFLIKNFSANTKKVRICFKKAEKNYANFLQYLF